MAVVPVSILVLILHFTMAPLPGRELIHFLIGALLIILGLAIFLLGVDLAVTPVGTHVGGALARRRSLPLMMGVGLVLGFFINVAEPNLLVIASQITHATGGIISVISVVLLASIGVGLMIALGLLRIIMQWALNNLLLICFGVICLLAVISSNDMLGIATDTSGATTGSMTVPFIFSPGHRCQPGPWREKSGRGQLRAGRFIHRRADDRGHDPDPCQGLDRCLRRYS